MTRPLVRISLLALLSIIGIAGMLMAEGGWDQTFLVLTALPLLFGSILCSYGITRTGGYTTDEVWTRH